MRGLNQAVDLRQYLVYFILFSVAFTLIQEYLEVIYNKSGDTNQNNKILNGTAKYKSINDFESFN